MNIDKLKLLIEAKSSSLIKYINLDTEITIARAIKMIQKRGGAVEILQWENPTDDLVVQAITIDPMLISRINPKHFNRKTILIAMGVGPIHVILNRQLKLTDGVIIKAFDAYGTDFFNKLINPSDKVIMAALDDDASWINFVSKPSKKVCQYYFDEIATYGAIDFTNKTELFKDIGIKSSAFNIGIIDSPTEKQKEAAIKIDSQVIEYFDDASEKLQLLAIKIDPSSYRFIINPTGKVMKAALKADSSLRSEIESGDIHELSDKEFMNIFKELPDLFDEDDWYWPDKGMSERRMKFVVNIRPQYILWMHNVPTSVWITAVKTDPSILDDVADFLELSELKDIPEDAWELYRRSIKYGVSNDDQKSFAFESKILKLRKILSD